MKRSASYRRWKEFIKYKKRLKRELWYNWSWTDNPIETWRDLDSPDLWTKKLKDCCTLCSCQSCRNPRRSSYHNQETKQTLQERRMNDVEKDQREDLHDWRIIIIYH